MTETVLRRVEPLPLEFDVDGDISLYPPGTEQAVLLNHTASSIWRRLATPTSMVNLVVSLAEEYSQPTGSIAADVASVVGVLEAQGLVVADPPPPAAV